RELTHPCLRGLEQLAWRSLPDTSPKFAVQALVRRIESQAALEQAAGARPRLAREWGGRVRLVESARERNQSRETVDIAGGRDGGRDAIPVDAERGDGIGVGTRFGWRVRPAHWRCVGAERFGDLHQQGRVAATRFGAQQFEGGERETLGADVVGLFSEPQESARSRKLVAVEATK